MTAGDEDDTRTFFPSLPEPDLLWSDTVSTMTLAVPSSVIYLNLRTNSSPLPSLNGCLLPLSGP